MSRKRKTIDVSTVLDRANRLLALDNVSADFRTGVASLLEDVLHKTGNYHGYNFLGWCQEGGCERWRLDGCPDNNDSYIGDTTRRVYYGPPGCSVGEGPIGYLIGTDKGFSRSAPSPSGFKVMGTCCGKAYASVLIIRNAAGIYRLSTEDHVSRVYRVNVFPYSQTCCECGKVLVKGQACGAADTCKRTASEGKDHTHWCELCSVPKDDLPATERS